FGRRNFIVNAIWQKRTSPDARLNIGDAHDHILIYAKDARRFSLNKISLSADQTAKFKNPDKDPKGFWASTDFTAQGWRPNQMYPITTPSGVTYEPPPGRCWSNLESEYKKLRIAERLWFGRDGDARPRVKNYLSEHEGVSAWSWWTNAEVGHNQEAKKEILAIFPGEDAFATPKPERLIQRILALATKPGDLVLDSFLGSGTTAAVAHKMGRRYIGIEMGEHAKTHCVPRLEKVIAGEQGGISEAVGWQGGGGFSFYTLGAPAFDESGRISADVKFPTLAAYVWHVETGTPGTQEFSTPFLGVCNGTAYFLLFNGVLGDLRPAGGNVLTSPLLARLREQCPEGLPLVVFGEKCGFGPARLAAERLTFKQIPYDIAMR
ncbi:MAG: site-specific DNA-methyltransferase, partial [Rhodoferax sp.]|nr:site-specific DNA-methyltransferase [Rhodoferax sp.]